MFVVTGEAYPDGLSIGALIHDYSGPIIFTRNGCVTSSALHLIRTVQPHDITLIGGTAAVPDSLLDFRVCGT